jgi:ABC-type uncharacterized transport system substrate-binding protein
MIRRRDFIALLGGAGVAWPFGANAQQPAIPVIGFLSGRSAASDSHLVAAFRQGLHETGYVDGRNAAIEFRWAEGRLFDRLTAMAADLVSRQVSAIFACALDVRVQAIRAAISEIPLVFATASDPVELGLVDSFNQPGGNATAVTVISVGLWPKRLQLLQELVATPAIALLVNPDDPRAEPSARDVDAAARALGRHMHVLQARSEDDFETMFATLVANRAGALLVTNNPLFNRHRARLIALAASHAVPAIYDRRDFPDDGGLMSYGASTIDQYRQSGFYVGRILKGVKPADLPVMQPTKFELVINLKTARALALTVPDKLLALADEVIE